MERSAVMGFPRTYLQLPTLTETQRYNLGEAWDLHQPLAWMGQLRTPAQRQKWCSWPLGSPAEVMAAVSDYAVLKNKIRLLTAPEPVLTANIKALPTVSIQPPQTWCPACGQKVKMVHSFPDHLTEGTCAR